MGGARPCAGRDSLSLPHGYHQCGAWLVVSASGHARRRRRRRCRDCFARRSVRCLTGSGRSLASRSARALGGSSGRESASRATAHRKTAGALHRGTHGHESGCRAGRWLPWRSDHAVGDDRCNRGVANPIVSSDNPREEESDRERRHCAWLRSSECGCPVYEDRYDEGDCQPARSRPSESAPS